MPEIAMRQELSEEAVNLCEAYGVTIGRTYECINNLNGESGTFRCTSISRNYSDGIVTLTEKHKTGIENANRHYTFAIIPFHLVGSTSPEVLTSINQPITEEAIYGYIDRCGDVSLPSDIKGIAGAMIKAGQGLFTNKDYVAV